jgi:hypothetical protein
VIPEDHSLRQFFAALVEKHFTEEAGVRDEQVTQYVTNLLTDYCESEQLFQLFDAQGRALSDVGEMLLEADPVYGPATSFDRERQVRKHIGDFTLFFTGMYPESINHFRLRRQRLENFIDFVKAGKESYYIVSKFDCFEYACVAPLFKKLAEQFEACVYGLNIVKNELEVMQHPITQRRNEFIM